MLSAADVDPGGTGIGTESSATDPTWSGGEVYTWEVSDDTGTPGTNWDLFNVDGTLTINATSGEGDKFKIWIISTGGTNGAYDNFDRTVNHSFKIVDGASAISGFDASKFEIDDFPFQFKNLEGGAGSSGFNTVGTWSISEDSNNLFLDFTGETYSPVPEPSTYVMVVGTLFLPGLAYFRKRRKDKSS